MTKKFIYNNSNGDNQESPGAYETSDFINSSTGAADSGKPIVLDATGKIDSSMISFDSLSWKNPVRVASTADVNIASPGVSIDNTTLVAGDRILLKDQTTLTENGIYVFDTSSTALTRSSDFDQDSEVVAGSAIIVTEGLVNPDTCWIVTTNNPITIGVTDIVFGPIPLVAGNNFGLFPIWAEENGGLANNAQEWSFGNGATGDIGITLPIDAEIFAMSYQADNSGTNTEISVEVNSVFAATTGPQSTNSGINLLAPTVSVSVGDVIGFRTIIGGGASDVRVCAWLKIPLAALTDMSLDNLSDVVITSPANGQVLYFNGTTWVNQQLDKNDVGLGNVDNTSDLDKPISTATQAALDDKIDKGGVCRIVNTGETYNSIVTAVSALSDYDTLHIFSQNSTEDIDLTGSNLSNVTFFGMGSSGTKNTVVGRVLLDNTCDSIEFHNIDMVTAGNDTVADTGSTNTRFNECNISRTSGSVSVRISGNSGAGPAFSGCVITEDISLNGTNILGFIYIKDSTISDVLSNSAQGMIIDRTVVNSSLQFSGASYVEIRDTITPTIISSQPSLGFTSLVISNTHIRSPFTPGAVGIINKTGTALYSLLNVDFNVAGSTLTGTDNSSGIPVSFAINCRGKNLADINALSRAAGTLHNAQDQSNKPYWDDGSTVNEIAYTSSIIPAPVDSVNGQTGTVVLDTDDIDDSTATNKYATQAQLDKVDFLTVTQNVDLDTLESDVATNNAKVSASGSIDTHSDVDLTGLANNDILVYDSGTSTFKPEPAPSGAVDSVNGQTGTVILDADDIDDSTTTNKYATQGQLDKIDFLTVTQSVDLDTLESDVTANNAKVSADGPVTTHNDVTSAGSGEIITNAERTKLNGIEALAEVNNISDVDATDLTDGGDSSLHFHSSDRNRANHTGTQTASTISDFDTEVSNNTDVVANTAKVSADGSIDTHSDVDLTGLADNDILVYDSVSGNFIPEAPASAPVTSVNSQTGVVVLDADDIDDTTTTNKFADQSQLDKVDFLTITQSVDLDTLETDVTANNAKVSASGSIDTHSDVDLTGLADNDILIYDSVTSTFKPEPVPSAPVSSVNLKVGVVVLDADDIGDSTTTNKFATQSQLDKVDFLTVTQPVDLDTIESDVTTNNAKVSASGSIGTHSDVDLTGLADNDILVYDSGTSTFKPEAAPPSDVTSVNGQTGAVVLDADDIDDSTTTNKYATQSQLDKIDFLTVTQAVDLDTLESDVAANNAKVSASGSIGTHSDVDLTGLSDNDILVYDSGTSTFKPEPAPSGAVDSVNGQTGVVVLDADDIDDATTTNKYATQSQLDKVDFLTVTQAVDLDTIETDVTANNAKVSADGSIGTHSDVDLTGLSNDDILVYDSISGTFKPEAQSPSGVTSVNGQTGVVVLDADDIDDSTTTNKFSTQSQLDKVDFISVTQPVDLDTLESDVAINNAKVSASLSINTHSDVDTVTNPPTSGDILRWNSTDNEWEPDSLVSSTFTYRKSFVAERSTASGGKLALGNGSTINTMGVVITEDCKLVSVGISSAGVTNGTWDIYNNGVSVHSTIKPVSLTYVDNLSSPVSLNANDFLNVICLAAGGAAHTVTFEVEITKTITGLKGEQGDQGLPGTDGIAQVRTGSGVPANTLGNDGDFYLDNNTGNYYTKSGGVWSLQGNLTGPSGAVPKILKLTNVFANNINSNTTLTFSGFDTSSLINDYGADITVASNGLTFVTGGRFRLDFNFFLTSNASRTNVLFRWAINGVEQRGRSAHNYIRNGSGHNESSSCLSEILDLSAGDVLTITCIRLGGAGTVNVPAGESIFQIESLS
ncbi:MAG: hypothetical protein GY787_09945 [Alteromonadales bacterium]|nr:hypothetical protein [Alteromonadales bacterium]